MKQGTILLFGTFVLSGLKISKTALDLLLVNLGLNSGHKPLSTKRMDLLTVS